jgi:pyridoxal phosphate enzyme (YggS family)
MDIDVAQNMEHVFARIEESASRVGRSPSQVKLVAVSKSQSPSKIREAYNHGLRDFGENRVYEALPKQKELASLEGIRWHMIGHIQSRKAQDVAPNFSLVHSVDRMKIARYLDKSAGEAGVNLPVLLECNVSGEDTKEGWLLTDHSSWEKSLAVFREITSFEHLRVCGLMTIAPWTQDEKILRFVFGALRALRDFLEERIPGYWQELSMGMSDDFEVAIEEGSTMVRIGRAIFGPREQE